MDMILKAKKVLIFAPHPDDEVLTCGAFLSQFEGQAWVFPLTFSDAAFINDNRADDVAKELVASSKILGFEILMDGHPQQDMHVETGGMTIKRMIRAIRRVEPDVVITTHPNCFHTDHRAAAIAAREAVYQASRVGILGSDKAIKEPLLLFGEVNVEGVTAMKLDVYTTTDESGVNAKVKALSVYKGFVNEHDSIVSKGTAENWIWSLARIRGSAIGSGLLAEAFEIGNIHPMVRLS